VFQEPVSNNNYEQNIYKPNPAKSKSESGNYIAKVRLVYNAHNVKRSVVDQAVYAMKDQDGFFLVRSSLAEGNRDCPIFKSWKKLWFSGDEANKAWVKQMYEKTESKWAMVQILEDENQPELVGQFKAMKLPKAIYEKMAARMNPAPETKKTPVAIMDYLIGLPLELNVQPGPDDPQNPTRKQREISYTLCDFESDYSPIIKVDGTPLFTDEELELIDNYNAAKQEIAKNKSKAKVEAAHQSIKDNTEAIKALYQKALDYVKENSFDLVEECAYKEWDAATTERVNKWIETVAVMQDPINGHVRSSQTQVSDSSQVAEEMVTADALDPFAQVAEQSAQKADDLPF
jgi:hypothetical protein